MKNPLSKISLGTVKLGIDDYGFSSNLSKVIDKQVFLKKVYDLGIIHFDTSPRYNNSESVLGEFIKNNGNNIIKVSTKIDNLTPNSKNSKFQILNSVQNSLNNLNLKKIDICYLHQNNLNIISDPFIHETLLYLKDNQIINHIGASIYTEDELAYAIQCGIYDHIQIPVNIFDISLYNDYVKNNRNNIKFIARSLLLQGLLVNEDKSGFKYSKEINFYKNEINSINYKKKYNLLEISLMFVFALNNIHQYIIGTTSIENFKNNLNFFEYKIEEDIFNLIYEIAKIPKYWSNPKTW
jgi:aryl-alcohol dehydrogenase-like predicted oxidoreductase